jgi:hypothetical protein
MIGVRELSVALQIVAACLLLTSGELPAAEGGAGLVGGPPSADPHRLAGVWSSGPMGARGPGAPAPTRAGGDNTSSTAPAPAGPRPGVAAGRSSTPPVVKAAFQDRFKPGQMAPNQGPLRNNDAAMLCVPDGFFGTGGGYPTLIMQTDNQITIVNEENHRFRRIYLDRRHPRGVRPSYAGHSVGRWDGDTLVVETVALRERDGAVHPPGYRIIEQFQKQDGGRSLRYTVGFLSDAYDMPGVNTSTWYYRPDLRIQEAVCEEFSDNFNAEYYK